MNIRDEILQQQINIAKEAAAASMQAKDQWIVETVVDLVGQDEGQVFARLVDALREKPNCKVASDGVRSFLHWHGVDIVLTVTRYGADGLGRLDQYTIIQNGEVVRSITWKSDF